MPETKAQTEHDKFCTLYELFFCECDVIAAIRDDERRLAAERVMELLWDPRIGGPKRGTYFVDDIIAAARGGQP